jgi:uncharacterized protein YjcR
MLKCERPEDLAAKLGVSISTVYKWKTRKPNLSHQKYIELLASLENGDKNGAAKH